MSNRYAEPFESVTCPDSRRDDGNHSWRFDGDDPYMLCVFCDERRDVLTGRALSSEDALDRQRLDRQVHIADLSRDVMEAMQPGANQWERRSGQISLGILLGLLGESGLQERPTT